MIDHIWMIIMGNIFKVPINYLVFLVFCPDLLKE